MENLPQYNILSNSSVIDDAYLYRMKSEMMSVNNKFFTTSKCSCPEAENRYIFGGNLATTSDNLSLLR